MKFARVRKTAHVFEIEGPQIDGPVSRTSLCGLKRGLGARIYSQRPDKAKLCGYCEEKAKKLAKRDDAKMAEEREKRREALMQTDLGKYGVHLNDIWETEKGTKFEVIRVFNGSVDVRSEHGPYPSTYHCPLNPSVFHKRLWSVGCGSQRSKVGMPEPKATESKRESTLPDELIPVVCDLWENEKGEHFRVEHVDRKDGKPDIFHIYYCKDNRRMRICQDGPKRPAFFHKVLERSGEEKVDEERLKVPVRGKTDDVCQPRVGDVWEGLAGERNKVLSVWWDADAGERVYAQDIESRFYRHCAANCMRLEKLVERDGKPVEPKLVPAPGFTIRSTVEGDIWDPQNQQWSKGKKVFSYSMEGLKPEATEEPEPKSQAGVLDGDIWANGNGQKFVVIRVHQGVAFCFYAEEKSHFIAAVFEAKFDKLLERNGRPYQAKRPQPQRGMDLATFGIHKGDKWQDLKGYEFTVVVPEDDGKGRIQAVNIEQTGNPSTRCRITEVETDTFHFLMERDGKSLEEV